MTTWSQIENQRTTDCLIRLIICFTTQNFISILSILLWSVGISLISGKQNVGISGFQLLIHNCCVERKIKWDFNLCSWKRKEMLTRSQTIEENRNIALFWSGVYILFSVISFSFFLGCYQTRRRIAKQNPKIKPSYQFISYCW